MIKTFEQQRFHRFIIELINIWALWKICENIIMTDKTKKKEINFYDVSTYCVSQRQQTTAEVSTFGGKVQKEKKKKKKKLAKRKMAEK